MKLNKFNMKLNKYEGLFCCRARKDYYRWNEFISYIKAQQWMDEQHGWLYDEKEKEYSQ